VLILVTGHVEQLLDADMHEQLLALVDGLIDTGDTDGLTTLLHELLVGLSADGDTDTIGVVIVKLVDADLTAVLTLAVSDLVSDLIESGDVEQLLALIATLDQLDADVLADADVVVMLTDLLDVLLGELVVAIEGETMDLESLRLVLTGLLESEVFGDELVLRLEAGELDAVLAAVVQELLEAEGAPGAPGDGVPTAPEAPGTEAPISEAPISEAPISEAPTTTGAPTAETSERPTAPEAPSDETRSLQAPATTAGAAATAQPTDQLPRTGAEALQLALLAMVALGAGALLLLTTQRRRLHAAPVARDGA
jgi:hypothetical protein